jgi:hypothetical protein
MDKINKRHHARKYRYGLTKDEFDNMVNERKGKCDICHQLPTGKRITLCVDHCHETKVIRGLLCNNCNQGLAFLGDDKNVGRRVNEYFKKSISKEMPERTKNQTEKEIMKDLEEWAESFF